MKKRDIFIEAIKKSDKISKPITSEIDKNCSIHEKSFDESYLQFLDEQIQLNTRGDDWTHRLIQRRNQLTPFCNRILLDCKISNGKHEYWIKIDPPKKEIVYFEEYNL